MVEGVYELRCLVCKRQSRPKIFHGLVSGHGFLCEMNANFGVLPTPTHRVTCPTCRDRLAKPAHQHLGVRQGPCKRCKKSVQLERTVVMSHDNVERMVLKCLQCGHRTESEELCHGRGYNQKTTWCGLPQGTVRERETWTGVNCPKCVEACRPDRENGQGQEAGEVFERCLLCAHVTRQVRHPLTQGPWTDYFVLKCLECGGYRGGARVAHFLDTKTKRTTCDQVKPQPQVAQMRDVTCGVCLRRLAERAETPIPDWRLVQVIPEDHFAH
jgi:hypothetical protein